MHPCMARQQVIVFVWEIQTSGFKSRTITRSTETNASLVEVSFAYPAVAAFSTSTQHVTLGKTLRDGQGQASDRADADVLDLIITNALIIDWSGIYKADIGVKNGIIVGIGKGGNPDVMDGVTDGMIVGSSTEVIAGEKLIITAGAIDAHVHYICVDLWREVCRSLGAYLQSTLTMTPPRHLHRASQLSSAVVPAPRQERTPPPAPRASST